MGTPPTIQFASLGMADSLILMVMALVVFGPRRLPQIGRQIGKLMYEFRKASNDFKFQMEEELRNAEEADRRKKEEERQKALASLTVEQASVSADPPSPVNAIESPNAGEGHHPPQYPPETPAMAPPGEESTPRIMPPSTGETVPANRSTRMAGPSEPAGEPGLGASSEVVIESGPEVSSKSADNPTDKSEPTPKLQDDAAAEALNHHG
jgi:sec-independent protein translocase protein TatB